MVEMERIDLTDAFVELFRKAATDLPPDMEKALAEAREREETGSAAEGALGALLQNVEVARRDGTPICQDTGTPIFEIYYPVGVSTRALARQVRRAAAIATEKSYLRPNAVDSLSGKNSGDNTGIDYPTIHFHEWQNGPDPAVGQQPFISSGNGNGRSAADTGIHVDLLLKGGGCENVSAQYKLPDARLKAGRDLDGVRRVVLDAVYQAQGKGCAPGVLGVAIGGDRGSSYIKSKQQLLRPLNDTNPEPELRQLEERLLQEGNQLDIGPMGFGGRTTLLGVKAGVQHRLPASYFVSIAYMCWANRRASMDVTFDQGEMEVRYG